MIRQGKIEKLKFYNITRLNLSHVKNVEIKVQIFNS